MRHRYVKPGHEPDDTTTPLTDDQWATAVDLATQISAIVAPEDGPELTAFEVDTDTIADNVVIAVDYDDRRIGDMGFYIDADMRRALNELEVLA